MQGGWQSEEAEEKHRYLFRMINMKKIRIQSSWVTFMEEKAHEKGTG